MATTAAVKPSDIQIVRDEIYWLRLMIGAAFIDGASAVVLQACTLVLRGREERLAHLEQLAAGSS